MMVYMAEKAGDVEAARSLRYEMKRLGMKLPSDGIPGMP